MNVPASLLVEVRTKRYRSISMKRSTHLKSAILSLTYLLRLLQQAHMSMYVAKEMNIFSRSGLHLNLALSTGKSICSKGVNIMSRFLIEILEGKVLLKTKVFHKSFSDRRMIAMM